MATKQLNQYNVGMAYNSSKVGTVRYYVRKGGTYVRAAHNSVKTNPRTDKQMKQRLRWGCIADMYGTLKRYLRANYFGKENYQSDFNMFMRNNFKKGVYFTKEQKKDGYMVALPLQLSDGKLKKIGYSIEDGQLVSDIALGALVIDANTSVAQFASAVIQNNEKERFKDGDLLQFVCLLQVMTNGVPSVKANFYKVNLDLHDDAKLLSIVTADGFKNVGGYLGSADNMPAGCFGYILSRIDEDGSFLISKQVLASNNSDTIAQYLTDSQFQLARDSYGKADVIFSRPDSGDEGGSPEPGEMFSIGGSVKEGQEDMGRVTGSGMYAQGSTAVLTAIPEEGYRFVKWSDENTEASRSFTVSEDIDLVAEFASNSVKLTLTAGTGGSVSPAGETEHEAGESVQITATPNSGWEFLKWSDGNMQNPRTIVINADMALQAQFQEE